MSSTNFTTKTCPSLLQLALAGVAQLVGVSSPKGRLKVCGFDSQQGTYPACSFNPPSGAYEKATS